MKRKLIFSVLIVFVITASTIFLSGGMIYVIASLMALAILGTIYLNSPIVMKMTRWAKANPKKTQFLIAGMHLLLLAIGIFAGNNFKELGYEFSGTPAYIFSTITVICFFSVNFLPKLRTIPIPKEVNRQRLAYTGIALSSFLMMLLFGNKLQDKYPDSIVTNVVKSIDQAIFPDDNAAFFYQYDTALEPRFNNDQVSTDMPSTMAVFASFEVVESESILPPSDLKKQSKANLKAEKKAKKFEKKKTRLMNMLSKKRSALAAGLTAGAVLLIILLVLAACAGVCLIVGGVLLLAEAEILGGLLAILAGVGIGYLSIKGISNVSRKDREKQQNEPKL